MKTYRQFILETSDYKGEHEAPMKGDGNSPMHDVTGTYPKDFYSHNGFKYYSDQGTHYDRESHDAVVRMKNKPNGFIQIHRAVPKNAKTNGIKPGDWVTHNRKYAHDHGKAHLKGDYKIISKTVRPRDLYTDGNSIHEWGYDPQKHDPATEKAKRAKGVETIKESIFGPHNGIVMHRHLVRYLNPERMRQVASKFRRKEDTVIPATDIHKSLPKDLNIRLSHSTHKMLSTEHDPHGAYTPDNGEGKHEITLGVISNSYDPEKLHKVFSSPAMGRATAHEHEHYTDYKGKKAKSKIIADVAMARGGKDSLRTGTVDGDKKYHNNPMEIRAHNVDMALAAREHVGKLSHTTNIKKTIASNDLRGHAYKGFVQNVDPSKRKAINGYINRLAKSNKNPSA